MKNLTKCCFLVIIITILACSKSKDDPIPNIINTSTFDMNQLLGMWKVDSTRTIISDSITNVVVSNVGSDNTGSDIYIAIVQDTMYNAPSQVINYSEWRYFTNTSDSILTFHLVNQSLDSVNYRILELSANRLVLRTINYFSNGGATSVTYLQEDRAYYSK